MRTLVLCATTLILALTSAAAEWYLSPSGEAAAAGSKEKPWDIESALAGKHQISAGDTLLLLEGTYKRRPKEQFEVHLVGTEQAPVVVRPAPGARATIDGGLLVENPSAFVWIRDLEILVSEPTPKDPTEPGSHPQSFTRPWGGLNMSGGKNCKFINLIIHDTRQGISCWSGSIDTEIYGCLIYDNGWLATDRGHGHCIYTQNKDGIKTISNCIMSCKYDGTLSIQAYGSKAADVDNYVIEDNILYEKGRLLIGGGKPSHNVKALRNVFHNVNLQVGYNAPFNEDCEVRDNVLLGGGISINKFNKVVNENNLVLGAKDQRPTEPKVILLPNKYDPARAHLAIFNFQKSPTVTVKVAPFLKPGDSYRLLDPKQFFGKPVAEGKCEGESISVPVSGEFAAFVLLRL
ncbi:MAG TPA: right-handed parallel beta-helix repeat-containing protein [Planctomycetota bacterium]|jgi:hypothetical protein